MDRFERVGELRDEYEVALDLAEERRGAYHKEIVKLHRAGVPLAEIAEHLGISRQRVHQIVGVAEPTERKRLGRKAGVAVIALAILGGAIVVAVESTGARVPLASASGAVPPSNPVARSRCVFASDQLAPSRPSSFSTISMGLAADALPSRCSAGTLVSIDPVTGRVMSAVEISRLGTNGFSVSAQRVVHRKD